MIAPALRFTSMLLSIILVAGGCGGPSVDPRSPAPGTPGPSPRPDPSSHPPGAIAHPTGASDVVLRLEEGGGLVPFGFFLTQAPEFTLYGDGTVVVRNPREDPLPDADGVSRQHPFRTATLDEPGVQAILAFALIQGGLANAREHYEHHQVADGLSTVFTIDADGSRKVVDVYALGFEGAPPIDAAARGAFALLVARLRELTADPAFATEPYAPHGYRAVLGDGSAGNPERPWPWPGLAPDDFTVPDANVGGLPQRVLTPEEMAEVGVPGHEGGVLNVMLRGPDGNLYALSTRPLLPDEAG